MPCAFCYCLSIFRSIASSLFYCFTLSTLSCNSFALSASVTLYFFCSCLSSVFVFLSRSFAFQISFSFTAIWFRILCYTLKIVSSLSSNNQRFQDSLTCQHVLKSVNIYFMITLILELFLRLIGFILIKCGFRVFKNLVDSVVKLLKL